MTQQTQRIRDAFLLIFPGFMLFSVFVLYPISHAGYLSFHTWDGLGKTTAAGFSNYIRAFKDAIFLKAVTNNLIFAVATTLLKNILGLGFAVLLFRGVRRSFFYRAVFFLPVTMSYVIVGFLWSWIYNPTFGLINGALKFLRLGFLIVGWLSDPKVALWSIIVVDVWKWFGLHLVILLAGLQSIPSSLFEMAQIEGSSEAKLFWEIILPLLMPVVLVSVAISIMGAFIGNFDLVYVMTGGGPGHATEVALTRIYAEAFGYGKMGYASALSFVLFIVVMIFTALQVRLMRTERYEF